MCVKIFCHTRNHGQQDLRQESHSPPEGKDLQDGGRECPEYILPFALYSVQLKSAVESGSWKEEGYQNRLRSNPLGYSSSFCAER